MSARHWRRSIAWAVLCVASLALSVRAEPPPSAAPAQEAVKPSAASDKPAASTKSKNATEPAAEHAAKTKTAAEHAATNKPAAEHAAKTKAAAPKSGTADTTASHASSANATPSKTVAPSTTPPAVAPPEPAPALQPAVAANDNSAQVSVPSTDHVHVEIPAGLQAWLNADDRMRPWLSKAVSVVDACYAELRASDPNASGTATFNLTMHANARPSASASSLPGPLQPLAMCVTSRLFGVKMPLFTGDEGATYAVHVRLSR